jgi:hypothetical protein
VKTGYLVVYLDQEFDEALLAGQIYPTRQTAIDFLQRRANLLNSMQHAEIYCIVLEDKTDAKIMPITKRSHN